MSNFWKIIPVTILLHRIICHMRNSALNIVYDERSWFLNMWFCNKQTWDRLCWEAEVKDENYKCTVIVNFITWCQLLPTKQQVRSIWPNIWQICTERKSLFNFDSITCHFCDGEIFCFWLYVHHVLSLEPEIHYFKRLLLTIWTQQCYQVGQQFICEFESSKLGIQCISRGIFDGCQQ